jgi:spermidine/putrescine-binding protein
MRSFCKPMSGRSRLAGGMAAAVLAFAACSGGAASSAPSSAASASSSASGAPSNATTLHVPILDQDMTLEQLKAEIAKEGDLVVANWSFPTDDLMEQQFKNYIKDTYGADINFSYEGTFAPSVYLTNVYAAQKGGNPVPYDVVAVEENYWADAIAHDAVDSFLPSDLVPNQKLVLDQFQRAPTAIAFQAAAYPAVNYNKTAAPFITKLTDLADPRLKGKVTLPSPGDITAGAFFMDLGAELDKDYKDPAQMKVVVDWAMTNIAPNVLKYTSDYAEITELLESGVVDAAAFWDGINRAAGFKGHPEITLLVPEVAYSVNGYMWVPKNAAHPVLAQIWINWRLSPEVQLPNDWPGISHADWAIWHYGLLGPSYASSVPEWYTTYSTDYPTLDQMANNFKTIDWDAYNASVKVWMDYYAEKLGQ